MKRTRAQQPQPDGLVGFYGHIWGPDHEDPNRKTLRFQFQIIRKLDDTRYVIQYYSMWDGSPNNLAVMSEAELLGDTVKLYPCIELWRDVADRFGEREARRIEAQEAKARNSRGGSIEERKASPA